MKQLKNFLKAHAPTMCSLLKILRCTLIDINRRLKIFLKLHAPKTWYLLKSLTYGSVGLRIDKRSEIKRILLECWDDYGFDFHPKDRRMAVITEKNISGCNTENIRFLINEIVRRFAKNGVYLEIGTFAGSSLLSAALCNPSTRCIGVDNFSQYDPNTNNEIILKENLEKFGTPKNIEYYNMDYREACKLLFSREKDLKIDVYYYDGPHSYEDQLEGLQLALPYLSQKCVILIDDINWKWVGDANAEFLRNNREFKSVFRIRSKAHLALDWWCGFQVITRGI